MDKMREEFEAWCNSIKFDLIINELTGNYEINHGFEMWLAWEASRAALRVELPTIHKLAVVSEPLMDADEVKFALEDAGVSYK